MGTEQANELSSAFQEHNFRPKHVTPLGKCGLIKGCRLGKDGGMGCSQFYLRSSWCVYLDSAERQQTNDRKGKAFVAIRSIRGRRGRIVNKGLIT